MIDSENISCIEKDETINNISFFPLEKKEKTKSQEKKTKRKKEGKKEPIHYMNFNIIVKFNSIVDTEKKEMYQCELLHKMMEDV